MGPENLDLPKKIPIFGSLGGYKEGESQRDTERTPQPNRPGGVGGFLLWSRTRLVNQFFFIFGLEEATWPNSSSFPAELPTEGRRPEKNEELL